MRILLYRLYCELSDRFNCVPNPTFARTLQHLYSLDVDGEVYLDASSLHGGVPFAVFAELIRAFLHHPEAFTSAISIAPLCEQPSERRQTGDFTLLRIKLKLSRRIDNESVQLLCSVLPACRQPIVVKEGQTSDQVPAAPSTVVAVLQCLDLSGSTYVSLAAGRALRNAVRRNVNIQHVFVDGCSINAATVTQIQRSTARNRNMVGAARSGLHLSPERSSLGVDVTHSTILSSLPFGEDHTRPTEPHNTNTDRLEGAALGVAAAQPPLAAQSFPVDSIHPTSKYGAQTDEKLDTTTPYFDALMGYDENPVTPEKPASTIWDALFTDRV